MRFVLALILAQTVAEVLPDVARVPWTQPEAMEYGGFVFIAVAIWVLLIRRSAS